MANQLPAVRQARICVDSIKRNWKRSFCSLLPLCLAGTAVLAEPATPTGNIGSSVSFSVFKQSLQTTTAADYLGRPGVNVQGSHAFDEMRAYLETYYQGITPTHSFVLGGQTVDCVPLAEQPALRGTQTIAAPPPEDKDAASREAGIKEAGPNVSINRTDRFGDRESCEAGTIPLRRLTLDEMTRFPNLHSFFRKDPGDSAVHEYAIAEQTVDNWGGNAALNLWKTTVNQNQGEDTSISQHWYVGGSGSNLQTAETGWINYPGKFGNDPVLFIYWTADAYNSTGCYNLECTAFVQTNFSWCLGCKFSHYSQTQGPQYEIELGYRLYQGNWWLKVGKNPWSAHDTGWLGYYPATIYNGGQMSQNAQEIQYGGEVAVNPNATDWPCMGSCHFADDGFRSAAYVRRVIYRGDTSNTHYTPSLTILESNSQCYTITQPADNGDRWKTFFYFGGPGNTSC